MKRDLSAINPKENIIIKGASLHNLKNIDVVIPRNKLVVITGLSGSGKSTLAFDTLYAEGQRRYVESLSSYARQFLGKLHKPKVDYIKGISPAIAIEQKVNSTNPRSTVGTSTEIYDYIKLLYARIGKTISPISGSQVKKHTVSDVVNFIKTFEERSKLLLLAPITINEKRDLKTVLQVLTQQGYARIKYNNNVVRIEDFPIDHYATSEEKGLFLVVDRIVTKNEDDFYNRLADAIQTAFFEGKGTCFIENLGDKTITEFSNKFELDGITFLEPNTHLFSFNNPYGACPTCEGYGSVVGIDKELVIPNTGLSIFEDAIFPFKTDSYKHYKNELVLNAMDFDIPIHKPWFELSEIQKELVWNGTNKFEGIHDLFNKLEEKSYKIQNRVLLSRYRGKTSCTDCNGKRLRKEANYIQVHGKIISELVTLPLDELSVFFNTLKLNKHELTIGKRLLTEIKNRLRFLTDVGLNYLTLNRTSNTLSGGESQRINLATSLGSSLVGSMYILDEPSIGLHPKDTEKLIEVLKNLRNLGNTVIVVEHDEDIMKHADYIIDIGPEAGTYGGNVVAQGTFDAIMKSDSLTAKYLSEELKIDIPKTRKTSKNTINIIGAREHNLKNIDVSFPLNTLTVITGVSGSGKSTLVKNILYPAMQKKLLGYGEKMGQFTEITGSFESIKHVEFIDQNPIGRSSRSNPVTYIKAYDDIRKLFSIQKLASIRNYQPKHFSFNVDAGRCEVCKGEGIVTIEMQFMADVHLQCDTCHGKRFKKEVLEVHFGKKSIDDILNLTIDDAVTFFEEREQFKISRKLKPLQDVGLGYVQLGQSSSTLSGGEAQRIKLASFLMKGNTKDKTLFIFDEPTTGLHFHDIKKLLRSFNALINKGHSIIVIEHNIELIKCADYIIDLGLQGGKNGGNLIFTGTPEDLIKNKDSFTAHYLADKLI
ncbi:excinuclease ABC subunit UvrA [Tenacibaculum finnmarkense]|uniref:UvrABC system protein A n=1 Tax=Tenacibaculum finnmarkense genomovar finnmarkense TaxID=1458503 RepID=A0AAP1RFE4_9FLAO|nr:excinuclease ABC subunit UvrA [Tenacibaculum finnmarkense]MBE7653023.1 excinuclease ABC subunit UvrA [Tenacibaculum finnmarkense genomovar finnmarkense]MBE7695324.1 excinuclease ABC subunit UvrA [Tenacibaculum finnmarkense genomovar finnmarkense]MCD8427533.1 excinuclease ABC subunit UvrA [Tenacibaculum finnmarkense genomovar finnmarkense]MCG8731227.1 excinuclease ABC subunit UvrA [Tenacibaculum finnmarkense]MCG8751706.1 excinuclease ABC subunit UvrA [Tenacibaculum finnmarkense]